MLKLFFWLFLLAVVYLLARNRVARVMRRMRGLPEPEPQKGPRDMTLAAIALVVIYAILISYRLYVDGLSAFHQ